MLHDQQLIGFVATTDAERALAFYRDTLGLELVVDDGFALVFRAGGNMLRVVRVDDFEPQPFTVLGWEVDDATEAASELAAAGVELIRYDFLDQDDAGVWDTPTGVRVAWFRDPDGNVLSVSEHP